MWQIWRRVGSLTCVLLSMGTGWTTGMGAQGLPPERPFPPLIAESSRGFTSITSVRELDGGRTLVADRGERNLYLVHWETGTVDQVLRRGDGPGEYRQIGWLYPIADDETLLTDYARRRWILLRGTEVVQTFTLNSPLNRRFGGRLDGVATGGGVLASVSAENPGSVGADVRVLEMAPGLGPYEGLPPLDTLRLLNGAGRIQLACVMATGSRPLCRFLEAEDRAILFPDGWTAVALQNPYRVLWRSPDGAWIRADTLDRSVSVSKAEKCAAISGWAGGDTECDATVVDSFVWPGTVPPFLSGSRLCQACWGLAAGEAPWLFADPRGRLVVRRTPQVSRRENLYDIVDRTGKLVDRVILPHGEAIVGFGESSVYTIRVDEYDLQWLRRHSWRD